MGDGWGCAKVDAGDEGGGAMTVTVELVMEQIKVCPFCGEPNRLSVYPIMDEWRVQCMTCNGLGPLARSKVISVLLWNAAANQVEQLKRERDEARHWAMEYKRRLIAAAKAMRGEG